jgi:hypothetical protein
MTAAALLYADDFEPTQMLTKSTLLAFFHVVNIIDN